MVGLQIQSLGWVASENKEGLWSVEIEMWIGTNERVHLHNHDTPLDSSGKCLFQLIILYTYMFCIISATLSFFSISVFVSVWFFESCLTWIFILIYFKVLIRSRHRLVTCNENKYYTKLRFAYVKKDSVLITRWAFFFTFTIRFIWTYVICYRLRLPNYYFFKSFWLEKNNFNIEELVPFTVFLQVILYE